MGKPASITSTPKASSAFATWNLLHCVQLASRNLFTILKGGIKINNLLSIFSSFYVIIGSKKNLSHLEVRKAFRIFSVIHIYAQHSLPLNL